MYNGKVKWFSKEKGYGFILWNTNTIRPDAPQFLLDTVNCKTKVKVFADEAQIMVHISNVVGSKVLNEGQEVSFDFKNGKFGAMADKVV